MKLAFLVLALVNLALFAWQQGAFGSLPESGREPERVNRQIEPERVRVLTQGEVRSLRARSREGARDAGAPAAGAPAPVPGTPIAVADLAGAECVELGDFTVETAARVQKRLEALALGERLTSRPVDAPGWFMVYVPPFKTRGEVERKAEELRKAGVKELLVIADNSPMRFGIALGSFKDQELATRHAADLERRGIKGVRVADKPSSVQVVRFQVRSVDTATAEALRAIQKDVNAARFQACTA